MWLQPHSTSAQLQWLCHLPPAPTPNPSSRYFFLSLLQVQLHFLQSSTTVPLLRNSRLRCLHSVIPASLLSRFSLPYSLHFFPCSAKKKKDGAKLKQSLSSWNDLSLGKHQRKSFYSGNEMSCCVIFSVSISKNPVLLASWVLGQRGACSWRYIAVGSQPKPGRSGRCK